ncbi:hypothetical protein BpHYR1_025298 [Brachionus plicatilis]|uniref:Uncharacterized protein n=1 Tax=Brachionus plicatilis TaxID=10195 RepID=A0A3M7QHZ6_BRAPC|nr:hypothetical protein BpHYR1_025298 [Brachionus plicatilis]
MIKKIYFYLFISRLFIFTENCRCEFEELDSFDVLFNETRIRIEYPDGLDKYNPDHLNQNSFLDCGSKAIYSGQKCRLCSVDGWSNFFECQINSCDSKLIKAPFVIETYDLKQISQSHVLFKPGEALAVYNFAPGKRICKYCQSNGEWSRLADNINCKKVKKPKPHCKYSELLSLEDKKVDFVRLQMETEEGFDVTKFMIDQDKIPSNTIVVYQSYLRNLAGIERGFSPYLESALSFRKKYCRYCENGQWSQIESCVEFRCNKKLLTGKPQLFLLNRSQQLKEEQFYFKSNSVLALYYFGSDKYCKQCDQNGEWSKFSLPELCTFNQSSNVFKRQRELFMNKLFKKEASCEITNKKFLYILLVNKKTVLLRSDVLHNSLIPSRSTAFYHNNKCIQCVNGQWSDESDCEFNYCLKDDVDKGVFRMRDSSVPDDRQNIFEPGSVLVEYKLSESTKMCKICEIVNGSRPSWSKYASSYWCSSQNAFFFSRNIHLIQKFCPIDRTIEEKGYIFLHVVSWNGRHYINKGPVPDTSVAVYVVDNVRWCSKCVDGEWESTFSECPVEFSTKKCDPKNLNGINYLVFVSSGLLLSDREKNELVFPGEVMAVYEFGLTKYCKECKIDGNWSLFPQTDLCKNINWII